MSRSHNRGGDDAESIISSVLSRQDVFQGFSSVGGPKTPGGNNFDAISDISGTNTRASTGTSTKSPKSGYKVKRTSSSGSVASLATGGGAGSPPKQTGRVKVGVRCRPPFQDEIDNPKDPYFSIIHCTGENKEAGQIGRVGLQQPNGKIRDFNYEVVFDQSATQDRVFDTLARPVVTDVLKGYNGTIFACMCFVLYCRAVLCCLCVAHVLLLLLL
jgi:hypothetical protein